MADSVPRTESTGRAARADAAPTALGARLASIAAVVRRLIGVPDYDTYLLHMRERYPQCTPMDRAAFERDRLTARYQRIGSRCC
jgi:uncharacterized short protein YbdD (DUF466 family)